MGFHVRTVGRIAVRTMSVIFRINVRRTVRIIAFVNLGVCVTQFDGDISFKLVLKTDSLQFVQRRGIPHLHARDSLDHSGLTMSNVTNCTYSITTYSKKSTNVDGSLVLHNFRVDRRQIAPIDIGSLFSHCNRSLFKEKQRQRNNRGNGDLHKTSCILKQTCDIV